MAYCGKCLHLDVCKTADSCDGHVPRCKHFVDKEDTKKVVRCKKCKYWHNRTFCTNVKTMDYGLTIRHTKGEDFCSYGERREGE